MTTLWGGRFDEAATYARLTIQANPAFSVPYAYLATAYVNLGQTEAAALAMRRLRDQEPAFTVEGFARTVRYPPALRDRLVSALTRVEQAR